MKSSRFVILSLIAFILILSGGIVSAQPSNTLYLDVTSLTDYPDFFGVSQAQYPPHIDTAIDIQVAEVTPEPIPNAGDCDGTTGDDVIDCASNPVTPDDRVEADLGNDTITIQNSVSISHVYGDGIPGTGNRRYGTEGGNDTINIFGNVVVVSGDRINNGDGGDDTITNEPTANVDTIFGDYIEILDGSPTIRGGDDVIVNNASDNVKIFGDGFANLSDGNPIYIGGNDIIINNGIAEYIYGDGMYAFYNDLGAGGNDEITNTGTITINIYGDLIAVANGTPNGEGASDIITNSGTVGGTIFAEGGDDLVVLQDGANGGDDNNLPVDGGIGTDTLRFDFLISDQTLLDQLSAQLASADPSSGSITIYGQTYTWTGFEVIDNQLAFGIGECDGDDSDNTIDCSVSPTTPDAIVDGGLGNDTITVQAGVTVSEVNGDSQSGGVASVGTGGFDLIDVYGTVTGDVNGDGVTGEGRDDTIVINESADIQGMINAGDGNDVVIIDIDAGVGGDDILDIEGGVGGNDDLLVFDVTGLSQATIDQIQNSIYLLSEVNGEVIDVLIIEGVSYNIAGFSRVSLYAELAIGDCDGTAGADTINCTTSPTNPDSIIDAGLGNDNITVAVDVQFDSLSGDSTSAIGYPITTNAIGGDDEITINTNMTVVDDLPELHIFGDGVTGDGGDDTITNNGVLQGDSGLTGNLAGDGIGLGLTDYIGAILSGDGGDDIITNTGSLGGIDGDYIFINRATFETTITYGGDDLITNEGVVGGISGDSLYFYPDSDYASVATPQPTTIFGGNDTIINNGQIGTEQYPLGAVGIIGDDIQSPGEGGDDTITNNGTVYGTIIGDGVSRIAGDTNIIGGQDIITNTGIVTSDIKGDFIVDMTPVFNTDFNYWEFDETISNDGNNDTITNSGTVGGTIFAEGGDDLVILQTGANGGDDNNLPVDGGIGTDTLRFVFTLDQSQINALNSADPANGSITIDGQTFTWTNFEAIEVLASVNCDGSASNDIIDCASSPNTPDAIVDGGLGNDTITVQAGVTVSEVNGDSQSGGVASVGDGGFDIITIDGLVTGDVNGDGATGGSGDDIFILNGEILGDIYGEHSAFTPQTQLNGHDVFVVNLTTSGGSDNRLVINAQDGRNTLILDLTGLSVAEIQQIRTDLVSNYDQVIIGDLTLIFYGIENVEVRGIVPAGDCDGTSAIDNITCSTDPINPDSSISLGLGADILNIADGVSVQSISGDSGSRNGGMGYPLYDGDNDQITVNGTVQYLRGDGVGGDGGNDTIIVEVTGYVDQISGDLIISDFDQEFIGNGGNDQITINGEAGLVDGDLIIPNLRAINYLLDNNLHVIGGNDIIVNNGTVSSLYGDTIFPDSAYGWNPDTMNANIGIGGDDTIINNGITNAIAGDIVSGSGGDDFINNTGTVEYDILGDYIIRYLSDLTAMAGQDTIINSGVVNGDIRSDYIEDCASLDEYGVCDGEFPTDGNNDTITNSGTVGGTIFAEGGDDLVILQTGANGGDDNNLPLDGGIGTDTLRFEFALSQTQIDEINALDPANDSYTIDGQTFTWTNFEVIQVASELDCPDGTAGDDIIVCETDPPFGTNLDTRVSGFEGEDHITINAGVNLLQVDGDGFGSGFDDIIINYGIIAGVIGDNSGSNGGDDTITNYGTMGSITGDVVYHVLDISEPLVGGNDILTNAESGLVQAWISGDSIIFGELDNIDGYGGNDQITNNGILTGMLAGDGFGRIDYSSMQYGGDDIIVNNGSIRVDDIDYPADIYGDFITGTNVIAGEDQITNTGLVEGNIYGDFVTLADDLVTPPTGEGAGDTITNSGTVGGAIYAEGGDDVVNLQDGANGGDDNSLTIDGGSGVDILNFDFTNLSQDILGALLLADPASGSIVINGQTFIWINFEQIITGPVPAPSAPTNMLVSGDIETPPAQPIYSWDHVPVATSYQFYVGGPSGQIINQTLVVGVDVTCNAICDFQPAIDLVQGNYTWWVQATNDSGSSEWVQGPNFYVGPAAPVVPTGLTVTGSLTQPPVLPTYSWDWDTSVAWYQVVVNSPNGNVFNSWFDASLICSESTCSITPETALTINGDYLWWVGGWNETAQAWSDSAGASFTVAIPLPITPENALVTGSLTQPPVQPTYSWDVDENVLWYQVVLTGATSGTIFNTWFDASTICNDTTCTISPPNELNNDAYTLWIGGWNPVGQTWNAGENFTVAIPLPAVPNNALVSGSLTQPPVLPTYSWDVDENVLWYQVVLTGATSGTIFNTWHDASLICDDTTCTISPTNELDNDTYTLWIGGWNTVGQTWNAGEIFVVDIPLPAVPTNITTSGTYNQPTYSWDVDDNALWYQVILNNSGGASVFNTWHDANLICTESTCSITPANVLPDGTYTLWVGGWNSSGQTWNAGESILITTP